MSIAFLRALLPRGSAMLIAAAMLLASLPGLAGQPGASAVDATSARQSLDIEAFVREGCPHCASAEGFLATLGRERPELRIAIRDVANDPGALDRLRNLAAAQGMGDARVPAIFVRGELIVGFSPEAGSDRRIREALARAPGTTGRAATEGAGTCEAEGSLACGAGPPGAEDFKVTILGRTLSLDDVGLPLFTLVMGLLDGFNPCSMWVLILMISLLAPLNDRPRMLAVAGTFVLIEGIAYLAFMAAWLNLFLFVGLSRASELAIAGLAIVAGTINLKDFWAFGRGISLSIPDAAKPGIYTRMRAILHAENLVAALMGTVLLALLVQIVELLCTSGFPALYTRILTLRQLEGPSYYAYLLLYIAAYMLDDVVVLAVGVVTLSQRRLQEREGRWLKLVSGLAMLGLGLYLIFRA
jgi:glutaredoxin